MKYLDKNGLGTLWADILEELDEHDVPAANITGVVSQTNLPSYVDDVIEGYFYNSKFWADSAHTTEITGERGKIYVDLSTNVSYRWSGSTFVSIGKVLEYATQAEAEAGSNNEKVMTPLRTKQAIDANAYQLPLMSASARGGAMVGDGLVISDGALSVDWSKAARAEDVQSLRDRLDASQSLRKGPDGYYVNESITAWFARNFDGKIYGYSEPKTTATTVTKTGANAGLPNPTLGTLTTEGHSVYRNLGPFQWKAAKGHVDADGVPHVKVIWGVDTLADWQACDEDVWSMRPVVYYSIDEDGSVSVNAQVSDTWHQGMKPNPQAYLPDGTLRPFMLAARHGLGFEGNVGVSKPGLKGYGRNVSHNSLITQLDYANTGYSGKTTYEDWYDKFFFRMIYGTKNSQSIMAGCSNYNYQYHPAVAETGVKRVILTNAQAANLVVGSTMMMGNQATVNTDRNNANAYNVFDGLVIASITTYDANNKAVNFDTDSTFDTATAYLLSTAPWHTGSCGDMDWDGTPTAAGATSGKEPFIFQGEELMNGNYEVLGNVILSSDGESGWIPYVNPDTRNEKTALSSDYISCETSIPVDSADSWKYPLYLSERSGMMYGTQTGGSQSAGICDGQYTNKVSTAGTREWLSLGNLGNGGNAGLSYVYGNSVLGYSGWHIWSRLSGVGRSRAAA